jgi:hypothetical protein
MIRLVAYNPILGVDEHHVNFSTDLIVFRASIQVGSKRILLTDRLEFKPFTQGQSLCIEQYLDAVGSLVRLLEEQNEITKALVENSPARRHKIYESQEKREPFNQIKKVCYQSISPILLDYLDSLGRPIKVGPYLNYDPTHYVYHRKAVYSSKLPLPEAQWIEAVDRMMARYEIRLGLAKPADQRTRIPLHVRDAVWRRDGGRCTKCGDRERLEFDHIIPVSKGGSNTERNLELLCESCNRAKGPQLT